MTDFFYEVFGFIVEKIFLPLLVIFLILFVIAIPYFIYQSLQEDKCCLRHDNKIVHQDAWTQYVMSGKVMIPIYHEAGDYYKNVCVEFKPDCK